MANGTVNILVFASGNGSNFQALADAIASGSLPHATITRLIVNRSKAGAIERAKKLGIPSEYFNLISDGFQVKSEKDPQRLHEARERYDAALAEKVLGASPRPELIVLAGWMYVFSEKFLGPLKAAGIKIINLHPALPGKYEGSHAIERAFADFQGGKLEGNKTGIMVHHVIEQVDQGNAILTREVEVFPGDDLEKLEERIHAEEHKLIVEATGLIVNEILANRKE